MKITASPLQAPMLTAVAAFARQMLRIALLGRELQEFAEVDRSGLIKIKAVTTDNA